MNTAKTSLARVLNCPLRRITVQNSTRSYFTSPRMSKLAKEEIAKLRNRHIGASCQLYFKNDPLEIDRGFMQYLYDENNREYLDCINNVAHVGHSNPEIVSAAASQLGLLSTNNRFLHENIVKLAKSLSGTLPGELSVCYFVNSGSEANDLAMRLAHCYTKKRDAIVLDHAYHGCITSCLHISPYKFNHPRAPDRKPTWVHVAPVPDTYRGIHRKPDADSGSPVHDEDHYADLYAGEVAKIVDELDAREATGAVHEDSGLRRGVAFFIAEAFQSCGGQLIYPRSYLRRVYERVHKSGGLCIADEVQTGLGRSGETFWAFEYYGVVPDIVTIGKSFGNGHPVSVVVTTPQIAAAFNQGPVFFSTFGGNPVSCAIAQTVLNICIRDNFQQRAKELGAYLLEAFETLRAKHRLIGDVRGCGLFVGIDLVKDRKTREPAEAEADQVLQAMREHGILLSLDGPYVNVLKLKPPMSITRSDAERIVATLDKVLSRFD